MGSNPILSTVVLAQTVRALVCETKGHGFDSRMPPMETIGVTIKEQECPNCHETHRWYHRTVEVSGILALHSHCMYCGYSIDEEI